MMSITKIKNIQKNIRVVTRSYFSRVYVLAKDPSASLFALSRLIHEHFLVSTLKIYHSSFTKHLVFNHNKITQNLRIRKLSNKIQRNSLIISMK